LVFGSFIKFGYLLIIFRERRRKSATAPDALKYAPRKAVWMKKLTQRGAQ